MPMLWSDDARLLGEQIILLFLPMRNCQKFWRIQQQPYCSAMCSPSKRASSDLSTSKITLNTSKIYHSPLEASEICKLIWSILENVLLKCNIKVMNRSHNLQEMTPWKKFYALSSSDVHCNDLIYFIQKPCIVGILEDGEEIKKPQHMNYFMLPEQWEYPLDLNKGVENYKFRPESEFSGNLDVIAKHLMSEKAERNNSGNGEISAKPKFQVITHRGLLASLMETPYYELLKRSWKILGIQYKNKLYLMKRFPGSFVSPSQTHHFKFRQCTFSDDPDRKPDTNSAINEKEQLYCIYRSNLDNLNFLYSGEIYGIISEKKIDDFNNLNQCRFVHTKLMWEHVPDWMVDHRIMEWWIKAYLAAVEDLYLGRKNKSGFVMQPIEHFAIRQLTENQKWSPKVCIKFMHTFINRIIEEMKGVDSPYTTYEFSFDHKKACIFYKVHEGKTVFSFLPEDFVEYLQK